MVGCSTYNTKSLSYQKKLLNGNTDGALKELEKNKFLQKKKNKLLYYLEKGKTEYLNGQYAESNVSLNLADNYLEDYKTTNVNRFFGVVTNPENKPYMGEDFEKVTIHYYKALNYIFLNQPDDALVEAKRINLQLQRLNDSYKSGKENRYNTDAFAINLQGLIYELIGETNNAFISYRNAVDLYYNHNNLYYGVSCPEQLKKDLLRISKKLGFTNDHLFYKEKFGGNFEDSQKSEGGEVVIFWENGMVPYKSQTYYTFSILPGKELGYLMVQNEELGISLPIPIGENDEKRDFTDLSVFNLAYPKYVQRPPNYSNASAAINGQSFDFELTEDYNNIAIQTLKERSSKELGEAALRLAAKKISELAIKEENEYIGVVVGLFNAINEHAETRNWQSLPNNIQYARIPLKIGENNIELHFVNQQGQSDQRTMNVIGTGKLQIEKVITLDSKLPNY